MRNIIMLLALSGCVSAVTITPSAVYHFHCHTMGDCLIKSNGICDGKPFTMKVEEGTKSAKTVQEWTPSSDGNFHLAVSCNN
jgi:hypothetical protein